MPRQLGWLGGPVENGGRRPLRPIEDRFGKRHRQEGQPRLLRQAGRLFARDPQMVPPIADEGGDGRRRPVVLRRIEKGFRIEADGGQDVAR